MLNKNVEGFLKGIVFYLKLIGFEFEYKNRWMKAYLTMVVLSLVIVLCGLAVFISQPDVDLQQRTAQSSYFNYYLVGILRVMALLYNRKVMLKVLNAFRHIYPRTEVEEAYNLQRYLKEYLWIEKLLVLVLSIIMCLYHASCLVFSLKEWIFVGTFPLNTPFLLWYPIDMRSCWPLYAVDYFLQSFTSFIVGTISMSLDLCLYGCLFQLCMHFDIMQRNILQIEPKKGAAAEKMLKKQIVYHELMLRLSEEVNTVFVPTVLFGLVSSSLIICFTAYQLLADVTLAMTIKSTFLLGFEMKQVIITCFLGDRLSKNSANIANAAYAHKWYNGTPRYRRLVLFIILRSQRYVGLRIIGISEVERQTLRKVLGNSYQIFTVLKARESHMQH